MNGVTQRELIEGLQVERRKMALPAAERPAVLVPATVAGLAERDLEVFEGWLAELAAAPPTAGH